MTKHQVPQFTQSQQQALAALGLPLWRQRIESAPAVPQEKEAEPVAQYFYKVGAWLIVTTMPMPVALPQWLRDLFSLFSKNPETELTELSAASVVSWPHTKRLSFTGSDLVQPSPATKQTTWQTLLASKASS